MFINLKIKILWKRKVYCLLFIIASLIVSMAFSQNKPWKQNGDDVNSNAKLGTTNNQPLRLITNDTERIVVSETGEVFVKDSIHVEGRLIAQEYIKTGSLHVLKRIKIGNSIYLGTNQLGTENTLYSTDDHLYIQCETPASNLEKDLLLCADGNSTGFVGIGTLSPAYKLEVNNDINLTSSVYHQGYRIGGDVVLQTPFEKLLLTI